MKLGIMGGTFDPVHLGHLRCALEVQEGLGLKEVLFVPSYAPPHKPAKGLTPFHHRLEMVKMAISSERSFKCLDIERGLPTPSYTVNTLNRLRDLYGNGTEFYFIMGSDAFFEIHSWHDHERIFDYAKVVVMVRERGGVDKITEFSKRHLISHYEGRRIIPFRVTHLDISSSKIRELMRKGRSPRYLIPSNCLKYMEEQGIRYGCKQ